MSNELTAESLIKREILHDVLDVSHIDGDTNEEVEELWLAAKADDDYTDLLSEAIEEFRQSGESTSFAVEEFSKQYDREWMAKKLSCGNSVSWLYWSGGGKFGNPGSIPYMNDAIIVDCKEVEKVVKYRSYTKI